MLDHTRKTYQYTRRLAASLATWLMRSLLPLRGTLPNRTLRSTVGKLWCQPAAALEAGQLSTVSSNPTASMDPMLTWLNLVMMYTRAAASDYDDWKKLGNPGWGAKSLLPLAAKVCRFSPSLV